MFTINQFNFTEENIRYFSNINHLAKDIKKFFVFLANREKNIFEELNKIKHTQLLQSISKAFGLTHYNEEYSNLTVDIDFLNRLIKSVSEYILNKTKIKEEFVIEVFKLLLLNIKNNKTDHLKSSVMKKINLRINNLEYFNNLDIYSGRRNKKEKLINESFKNLISEEDYNLFKELFDNFKFDFNYYKQIINKNYQFVWYPYAFEKYNYHFSFSKIEEVKEMLEKAKIYKYFTDIKDLLNDWIMASNIKLFNNGNIEETYYVQNKNNNKYVELLLTSYEISLDFHGGRRFGTILVGSSPLISLKHEHLKSKYNNQIILNKITWKDSNYFLVNIHTYDNLFEFCCGKDFIGFKNLNKEENFIKCFIFKDNTNNVECFSHFGNACYETKYMKNFFIFKREQDYFEYNIFNEEDLIYIVQFKIDQFIIKTPTKKIIIQYEDLLREGSFDLEI